MEEIVSDPKSRKELEQAVITEESGHVFLDGFYFSESSFSPSTFPVVFFNWEYFKKRDEKRGEPVVFYFPRQSFEKMEIIGEKFEREATVDAKTNSLVNYVFAAIYAEQLASGETRKNLSAPELKSLNGLGLIVNRRSALDGTYAYFRDMYGSQNPATHFVEIVLKNSNRINRR